MMDVLPPPLIGFERPAIIRRATPDLLLPVTGMVPGAMPVPGRPKPASAASVVYNNGVASSASSRTYTGIAGGAEDPARRYLVTTFGGGTARTLNSFTVNSVEVERIFTGSFFCAGVTDIIPTGTTINGYVEWNGTKSSFALMVCRMTNVVNKLPHASSPGSISFASLVASATIDVPAGAVIAGYYHGGGANKRTVTWAGATEAFDADIRTIASDGYSETHSGAVAAVSGFEAGRVVSVTLSGEPGDSKVAYAWVFE